MADPQRPPTRQRLIQAGMDLLDELPADRLLAGVPAAAVAEAAGVTTGSFFHHFPTSTDFARAVALEFLEDQTDAESIQEIADELVGALAHQDLVGGVRAETNRTWETFSTDPVLRRRFRVLLHLWSHSDVSFGGTEGPADIAEIIRTTYRVRSGASEAGWRQVLRHCGLEHAPPFDYDRISVALTALLDGLLMRHLVDPDVVDDQLYGDMCATITATVHRPSEELRRRIEELAGVDRDREERTPQAVSGLRRRRQSRDHIARAAVGMFADGWERVSLTDVADRADVSPQTVLNLFGDVRGVAALTFSRYLTVLRSRLRSAQTAAADGGDVLAPLRAVLALLAELAAGDVEATRALLEQRIRTAVRSGEDLGEFDVRLEVPLAEIVGTALAPVDLGGEDLADVTTLVINFVLTQGLAGQGSAERIAEHALALLPPRAADVAPDGVG